MDKQWWLGVLAAVVLSVIGTITAIFVFAGDKYIEDIAVVAVENNRVITKSEADQIRKSVASLDATQKSMLEVQNKILDALLND